MKKLHTILVSLMMAAVLSACGSTTATNNTQNSAANGGAQDSGKTAGAVNADTPKQAADAKIASMSIHLTNNLLALGIKPAGSVIGGDVKDFLPHVKDQLQGVTKFGVVTDPDMEAVLGVKPDAIYLDSVLSGKDEAKFKAIAPTVSINMDEGTWRDHLQTVAEHVGRKGEAQAFIQQYDAKAAKASALIHKKLGADAKVLTIRITPKELRVMGTKRPLGPIMFDDLKLRMADGVANIDPKEPFQVISKEVLPDFNADAIFVIVNANEQSKANYEEMTKNAVWQNLKAVKSNQVYLLDGQKWLDYSSIGQDMALDDALKLFAE